MKKRHTKLQLSRETLHRLTQNDLRHVAGREATDRTDLSECFCPRLPTLDTCYLSCGC